MDDVDPFDDDEGGGFPFGELFGQNPEEMMRSFMALFGGAMGGGADQAVNIAISIASGGTPESNVDPTDRIALEQLARVAELQIAEATGLRTSTDRPLGIAPVNRTEWVRRSIQAYKPVLDQLAESLAAPAVGDDTDLGSDPELQLLDQLFGSLRPMLVGVTAGSMVGHLGSRALGTYDLPIPRPGIDEILVVVPNLDALGEEWSLDREELRLWLVLSEMAHHAVIARPHVAARLQALLLDYTSAFRNDPVALGESLGDFDPSADPADLQSQLQSMFGDPGALLGAMRSEEQERILPHLSALCGAIVGYVDHVMDRVGHNLIPGYAQLTEALRRRRVTASESDRFVERLLGLELDQALYDRGRSFVDGVVERAGEDALTRLWEREETLPTPNELDAPGLWLARIDLPDES